MPDGSPRSTRRRSSGSASRSSAPTHRRQGSPCPARRGGGPWIPDHRPVARSSPSLLASVGAVGCRVRGSHWWRGPSVSTHHLRLYVDRQHVIAELRTQAHVAQVCDLFIGVSSVGGLK